jgi:hypothetical protein
MHKSSMLMKNQEEHFLLPSLLLLRLLRLTMCYER